MITQFTLPDVGEGIAEAELVTWLVDVGDAVQEDQQLAEVETDKSLVELPSPVNGTVTEFHAGEGELVAVGDVLVTFETDGDTEVEATEPATVEESPSRPAGEPEEPDGSGATTVPRPTDDEASVHDQRVFAAPNVRRLARERGIDIEAVAESIGGGTVTRKDVLAVAEGGDEVTTATDTAKEPATGQVPREASGESPGETTMEQKRTAAAATEHAVERADRDRTLATPAVRRIAAELDVDLDAVPASGHHGDNAFVTEYAVRESAERQSRDEAETGSESTPTEPATGTTEAEPAEQAASDSSMLVEERVPYRGIRRTIGEQVKRSRYTAPHVTRHQQVNTGQLVEVQEELAAVADDRGVNLTYMPFVMKAVTAGLIEYPYLNASLDEENEEILLKGHYNIGVATATEEGLMVPVVDDVDEKNILEIANELESVAERARERTITPAELSGSTFTITNIGPIGGFFGTPIINYPEVGILALGEIKRRPWVRDEQVVAAYTLPLSLSYDHRIIDGATGAQFMNTVMEYLHHPNHLLME